MLIGREVTVLGGGIGGLAAAVALARRGARVRVLEQAPAITEVGAGIQISPNGWAVLEALGIAEAVAARAPRSRAVRLRSETGAEVFSMALDNPRAPWHLVHRADLVDVLARAATAAGVQLELAIAATSVVPDGQGARLVLADGSVRQVDLLVAADGVKSVARPALNPASQAFFTGQVAWRATVPQDGSLPVEAHVFMGPGRHLVRYPLRQGALVNLVAVEERAAWAEEGWHHRDDPQNLRRAFAGFCPEITDLLARVDEVHLWGLFRHEVAARWTAGGVALLGDAAHPTLPFLAQGANMALEDAWVLARCLADEADTPVALDRYARLRRPRCARIVAAANENARNYHLAPGPRRLVAHTALRLASRFAPRAVSGRYAWIHGHDVTDPGSA